MLSKFFYAFHLKKVKSGRTYAVSCSKNIYNSILFPLCRSCGGPSTPELIVYSNKFYTTEKNSAHHAEIYDQTEITNSGYNNLFDFLSNKSSLNISSYSGNKATPLIDMRGYGLESGYQNIVINVDGFRINSIDMSPSFLGTLNTNDIERIEILKGSGSVIHGDGSNAGSINIFTKHHKNTRISSSFGNFGQKNHSFSTGKKSRILISPFLQTMKVMTGIAKRMPMVIKIKAKHQTKPLRCVIAQTRTHR